MSSGGDVEFFRNVHELAGYTMASKKRIYPRKSVPNGSPLKELLRIVVW